MFFRYLKYLIYSMVLVWFVGCEWDPDHSNPFDPDNPNYEEIGNLRLKVYPLDRHADPIPGVTVLISELGRFEITDESGQVFFDQVPADTLKVVAYRNDNSEIVYARDSIEVIVEPYKTKFDSLRLDAVPIIDSCKVNSVTLIEDSSGYDITKVSARLTAWVRDPDGILDLDSVVFSFPEIRRKLSYNLDSLFWRTDIPSEEFPGGDLRNTILKFFTFEAFDKTKNFTHAETLLGRVINGVPRLYPHSGSATPLLDWTYLLYNQLPNIESFNYLLRIYTADAERDTVYQRIVVPDESSYNTHQIEKELDYGDYFYQVWVIDLFGNMSRSKPETIEVPPPPPN
ncbi:hypothetical protein K9N50_07630 [bacterium]|nr:hypothetical protein [bacterium]